MLGAEAADPALKGIVARLANADPFPIPNRADQDQTGLFRYLEKQGAGVDFTREMISSSIEEAKFQAPRYEGGIEGTEVGMTFFFTDLAAKLFGMVAIANDSGRDLNGQIDRDKLDLHSLKPPAEEENRYMELAIPAVAGFKPVSSMVLTGFQFREMKAYPSGRLWWGIDPSSVSFDANGDIVRFAPRVMRLHMRSKAHATSQEVQANPGFGMYCSSFNQHFLEVAQLEPEFQRLNSIFALHAAMKFGQQMSRSEAWRFLSAVKVAKPQQDFRSWYARAVASGRTSIQLTLPSLEFDKAPSDAMRFFASRPFQNGAVLKGGVTGPSWNELSRSIVKTSADQPRGIPPEFIRSELDGVRAGSDISVKSDGRFKLDHVGEHSVVQVEKATSNLEHTPYTSRIVRNSEAGLRMQTDLTLTRSPNETGTEAKFDMRVASGGGGGEPPPTGRVTVSVPDDPGRPLKLKYEQGIESRTYSVMHALAVESSIPDYMTTRYDPLDPRRVFVRLDQRGNEWVELTRQTEDTPDATGIRYGKPGTLDWVQGRLLVGADLPSTAKEGREAWLRFEITEQGSELRPRWIANVIPGKRFEVLVGDQETSVAVYLEQTESRFGIEITPLLERKDAATQLKLKQLNELLPPVFDEQFAAVASRDEVGRLVVAGRNAALSRELWAYLDGLIPSESRSLTLAVRTDAEDYVRVTTYGIVEVPTKASESTLAILGSIAKGVKANPELMYDLARLETVSVHDIETLGQLGEVQRMSYSEFKSVDLPSDLAVVNLRLEAGKPNALARTAGGLPAAKELRSISGEQLALLTEKVHDFYKGKRADFDFVAETKPYFELLKEMAASTQARRIVVAEDAALNSDIIWRVHGGNPKIRFIHDQPSIIQSVENAEKDVAPDIARTRVLVTLGDDFADDDNELQDLIDEIESHVVRIDGSITFADFQRVLADPNAMQIVLVTSLHEDSVQFADRKVELLDLTLSLEECPPKEFALIVSNESHRVANAFSESGLFRRIAHSSYVPASTVGLRSAIGTVRKFLASFATHEAEFTRAQFEELLKTVAEESLRDAIRKAAKAEGESFIVNTRELSRKQRASLSSEATLSIRNAARRKPVTDRNRAIDAIIEEVGRETIEQLRQPKRPPNLNDAIRAIPRLKVEVMPKRPYWIPLTLLA